MSYICLTIQPGGFVAYDVLIVLELEGGDALSNLTLVSGSLEPGGCSSGDEQFTTGVKSVSLSKLLTNCRAELSFTALVCCLLLSHNDILLHFHYLDFRFTSGCWTKYYHPCLPGYVLCDTQSFNTSKNTIWK